MDYLKRLTLKIHPVLEWSDMQHPLEIPLRAIGGMNVETLLRVRRTCKHVAKTSFMEMKGSECMKFIVKMAEIEENYRNSFLLIEEEKSPNNISKEETMRFETIEHNDLRRSFFLFGEDAVRQPPVFYLIY